MSFGVIFPARVLFQYISLYDFSHTLTHPHAERERESECGCADMTVRARERKREREKISDGNDSI